MLTAAKRNKLVTFEQPTETNTRGEVTVTWSELFEEWAEVKPLQGREYYQAAQVHAEVTHRVTIVYRSGVTAKCRIRWGDRYLYLVGPPRNRDEANRELEMLVKETP